MIDPAILGAGRLEKKFYIGPPDLTLREELFKLYLKKKPLDFGIDYLKLANLTEHRVTAEIELICSEAARNALQADSKVTMQIIENAIVKVKPTISLAELKKYEDIRRKIEGEDGDEPSGRPRIGFKS
jgi:transitional endoplasmic reticulum ATPase